VVEAKSRLGEDHLPELLRERVRAWQEAEALRAYCDAIVSRHGIETNSTNLAAAQWLALARAHADRAHPLPEMPPDPELTPRSSGHISKDAAAIDPLAGDGGSAGLWRP
jgi:hypothetical protein